jgi:protein tyrosine phosphatase (PTP) superfamily phosphohydrolase (DUF442 family)
MTPKQINKDFSVAEQILPGEFNEIAIAGYKCPTSAPIGQNA